MHTYSPPEGPQKRIKPVKVLVDWLVSLILMAILVVPVYVLVTGLSPKIYPVGIEVSYDKFQIEVFQVLHKSSGFEKELPFCNYGLVEVEVSLRLKEVGLFKSAENIIPSQFSLYNAKSDRLYIQPTATVFRQPAFQGGDMQAGDRQRGWLTFCPFEPPQNLQLRFLPQRPAKGTTPLKIDLQPALKTD